MNESSSRATRFPGRAPAGVGVILIGLATVTLAAAKPTLRSVQVRKAPVFRERDLYQPAYTYLDYGTRVRELERDEEKTWSHINGTDGVDSIIGWTFSYCLIEPEIVTRSKNGEFQPGDANARAMVAGDKGLGDPDLKAGLLRIDSGMSEADFLLVDSLEARRVPHEDVLRFLAEGDLRTSGGGQ